MKKAPNHVWLDAYNYSPRVHLNQEYVPRDTFCKALVGVRKAARQGREPVW